MTTHKKTQVYMLSVIITGFACLAAALLNLPIHNIDFHLLVLSLFTIGLGSRISVKIPRFKSHISVSDTFIFFALLYFGGEIAIALAAGDAAASSLRFCKKKITILFNIASSAISLTVVVFILNLFDLYSENLWHGQGENLSDFFIALCVIALTQFFINTSIASIYGAFKSEKPIWETWKTQYLWLFVTYIVGAAGAGILVKLTEFAGFSVVIAAFPIIFFVFLTYRMYMKNVEISIAQAEQAKKHAEILEQQASALRESEERFRSAFNYAPIGIALVSPSGSWLKVNRALYDILGYTEEEFLCTNFQSMLSSEDLGNTLVKIHELLEGDI